MRGTIALMTQGSTKIFKQRSGAVTRQSMRVEVHEDSTCILIPDPVQPFAESSYVQRQDFNLCSSSNLIVLDWLVSGRPANGEIWDFQQYDSTNRIHCGRLLLRDCQIMRHLETKQQMGKYNCIATLLCTGPALISASDALIKQFKQEERLRKTRVAINHSLLYTVTNHRDVTVVKVIGISSELVKEFLSDLIDATDWRQRFGSSPFRALE